MTDAERKRRLEKLAGFVLPKGNYTLQEHVATSHMSVVYKALDNASRRTVAIKILLDERYFWRFENEFELSYDLTVTNIAVTTRADLDGETIYDGEGEIAVKYLVMKWLSGLSLLDIIRKNREDPKPTQQLLEDTLNILRRLAPALDTIHYKGIYHRDIKPSNIRFNSDINERQEPYLLDFGVAKKGYLTETETLVTSHESTMTGEYTGTPRYMPPEQWDGDVASGASDQYALAITIYEFLSDGNSPFRKSIQSTATTSALGNGTNPANFYAWQKAHRESEPTPIKEYRFDVPEAVWQVLRQAMSRDASQRFENIKAFQQALERAVHPFSSTLRSNVAATSPIYRPPPEFQVAPIPSSPKPEPEPEKQGRPLLFIIGAIIILAIVATGALVVLPSFLGPPTPAPTVTVTTSEAVVAAASNETPTIPPSATLISPTAASTVAPTDTPSPTNTLTPTETPSPTNTATLTPSPSATLTPSPSPTPTDTPTETPIPPTATPTLTPTPMPEDFLNLLEEIARASSSAARFDCATYVEAYEELQYSARISPATAEVAIIVPLIGNEAETLPALYEYCHQAQNQTQNRVQLPSNLSNNQFRDLRTTIGEAKLAIQALR
jgi:eukaryotic-like serine/threonine-protein kinase